MIDEIDNGGAEGVLSALRVVKADEFREEAMSRIDSDAIDDIVHVIFAISGPHIQSLPEKAVQEAISQALDTTMHETLTEFTGAMVDALLPIRELVKVTIQRAIATLSIGAGCQNLASFLISLVGDKLICERATIMTEGFSQYVDVWRPWIVVKVCLELLHSVIKQQEPSGPEGDWNSIFAIVEIAREAVMPLERISGRNAEVAGRRMLYSLEEACRCASAWGSRPEDLAYDFRNQVQWEETALLMDSPTCSWILS